MMCAKSAAQTGKQAGFPAVDEKQVEDYVERLYAPMLRENGVKAKDVVRQVQKAVGPMEQMVYMSSHRIDTALRYVEKAKEMLGQLQANDFHELLNCHEAEAAVLSAEMQFRASQMRKESRGWFLREDYPDMDNENWLKWIIVKKQGDDMKLSTEDVPWEKWPIKPSRT
jgi:succinate dehydrogenase/fumarate reductase flavoprotein subunit